MGRVHPNTATFGIWLLAASSAAGLVVSIFDYFGSAGIQGTGGVMLVIASTALLLVASLFVAVVPSMPRWLGGLLLALLVLGVLGTGLAAYFLEASWLLALMVLALFGWLVRLVANGEPATVATHHVHSGSMQ